MRNWTHIDNIVRVAKNKQRPNQLWEVYGRDHYKMVVFSVAGVSFLSKVVSDKLSGFKKADVIKDFWHHYDNTAWESGFENPISNARLGDVFDDEGIEYRSAFIGNFVRISHDLGNKFSKYALRVDVSFKGLEPSSYTESGIEWADVGFIPDPVSKYLIDIGGNETIAIDLANVAETNNGKNMKITVVAGRKLQPSSVEFIPKKKLSGKELRSYLIRIESHNHSKWQGDWSAGEKVDIIVDDISRGKAIVERRTRS